MRVDFEDQVVPEHLEMNQTHERKNKVHKQSKIKYTRKFLLSFMELEICDELPGRFKPQILVEFDNESTMTCKHDQKATCSLALPSSRHDAYGSSLSSGGYWNNTSQELSKKWDADSWWLINKGSYSRSNCDSGSLPLPSSSCDAYGSSLLSRRNSSSTSQESSGTWDGNSCWLIKKESYSQSKCNSDSPLLSSSHDAYVSSVSSKSNLTSTSQGSSAKRDTNSCWLINKISYSQRNCDSDPLLSSTSDAFGSALSSRSNLKNTSQESSGKRDTNSCWSINKESHPQAKHDSGSFSMLSSSHDACGSSLSCGSNSKSTSQKSSGKRDTNLCRLKNKESCSRSKCDLGSLSLLISSHDAYGSSLSGSNSKNPSQESSGKRDTNSCWLKNKESYSQRKCDTGSLSLLSSSHDAYGSSLSFRSNSRNTSQESPAKRDTNPCWLTNKDNSRSKCVSDSKKLDGDLPLYSRQNHEIGILRNGAFDGISGCRAGLSALVVKENGDYKLNKCENPYRPPSMYKVKNGKSEADLLSSKSSIVSNSTCENEYEQKPEKHKTSGDQQGEATINAPDVSGSNSDGISNRSHLPTAILQSCAAHQNGLTDCGIPRVVEVVTAGSSESSDNEQGRSIVKELSKDDNAEVDNIQVQTLICSKVPTMSAEGSAKRTDISEMYGSIFSEEDADFLTTLLDNCGIFDISDEQIIEMRFSERYEVNESEDDQSTYEDAWAEILSMLRTEQELNFSPVASSNKTVDPEDELRVPDEDALMEFDYKRSCENLSVIHTEEQQTHTLLPESDLEDEIELPDEESLITIDDLIDPAQRLNSPVNGNSVRADKLNSEVPAGPDGTAAPDVTHHDGKSTIVCSEAPTCDNVHLHHSPPVSDHPKRDVGKPVSNHVISQNIDHHDPPCSWNTPAATMKGYGNPACYSVLEQPKSFPQQNLVHVGAAHPGPVTHMTCYKYALDMVCPGHFPVQPNYQGLGMLNPVIQEVGGWRGYTQAAVCSFMANNLQTDRLQQFALADSTTNNFPQDFGTDLPIFRYSIFSSSEKVCHFLMS